MAIEELERNIRLAEDLCPGITDRMVKHIIDRWEVLSALSLSMLVFVLQMRVALSPAASFMLLFFVSFISIRFTKKFEQK